jgi:mannosyltransferase OCH1-like enzyme
MNDDYNHSYTYYKKIIKIFRTIHIVWVGDESKRPDSCINTWAQQNPDWKIRIWGNNELCSMEWKNSRHINTMLNRELCGVADLMRWEILSKHGGFAIDADSICVRPLENWLFEADIFACWENEICRPGLIANGYVYSHPNNILINSIIDDIYDSNLDDDKLAWQLTGPTRITDIFRKISYNNITIYPSHYFLPRHYTGIEYSGSGPVFAQQFWGRALPNVYENLLQI